MTSRQTDGSCLQRIEIEDWCIEVLKTTDNGYNRNYSNNCLGDTVIWAFVRRSKT